MLISHFPNASDNCSVGPETRPAVILSQEPTLQIWNCYYSQELVGELKETGLWVAESAR